MANNPMRERLGEVFTDLTSSNPKFADALATVMEGLYEAGYRQAAEDTATELEVVFKAIKKVGRMHEETLKQIASAGLEPEPTPELSPWDKAVQTVESETLEAALDVPIEELGLTIRPYNCFRREGIDTVAHLVRRNEEDLRDIRNLGTKAIEEVRTKLLQFLQKKFGIEVDPADLIVAPRFDIDEVVESQSY